MMKKIFATAVLLFCMIFSAANLAYGQDGFFSDAKVLSEGQFNLGVQPIIYTEADNFMLTLRGGYGLKPNLSLYGKLGLFDDRDTYIGGHLKYMVAGEPSDPLSFSIIGGIYSFTDVGLKFSGILSKNLGDLSLYSGLSYEPLFVEHNTLNAFMLPIGVDIPFSPQSSFMMEGDINVNNDGKPYQAITFGMNFYF